jgi:hypothetical protein
MIIQRSKQLLVRRAVSARDPFIGISVEMAIDPAIYGHTLITT